MPALSLPTECTPKTGDKGRDTSTLLNRARACPIPTILGSLLGSRPSCLGLGLGCGFGRARVSMPMNLRFMRFLPHAPPPLHRHHRLQQATAFRPHRHSPVHVSNTYLHEYSHRPRQGGTVSSFRAKTEKHPNEVALGYGGEHQDPKKTPP